MSYDDVSYSRVANLVKEMTDNCAGAITITREELKEEIIKMDGSVVFCPQGVFDHLTLALRRVGLTSIYLDGVNGKKLLIHKVSMSREEAVAHCKKIGVSRLLKREPALAI